MRQIKFRAWDFEEAEMIQPEDLLTINGSRYLNESLAHNEKVTFMQFTGLTDKNGVEIYEGDILGSEKSEDNAWYISHHQVVWHDSGFKGKQVCSYGSYIGIHYYTQGHHPYVVIGNIHQNPELLERTQRAKKLKPKKESKL